MHIVKILTTSTHIGPVFWHLDVVAPCGYWIRSHGEYEMQVRAVPCGALFRLRSRRTVGISLKIKDQRSNRTFESCTSMSHQSPATRITCVRSFQRQSHNINKKAIFTFQTKWSKYGCYHLHVLSNFSKDPTHCMIEKVVLLKVAQKLALYTTFFSVACSNLQKQLHYSICCPLFSK